MAMVKVRVMRMRMNKLLMPMDVRMRFTRRIGGCMSMLMVLVMPVQMFVDEWFVLVQMGVVFGKMQPDAEDHQPTGNPEKQGHVLVQQC